MENNPDLLLDRIGMRIAKRRQELGLTQKNLGDILGITSVNVSRIERGQQNLTIRTLCRVADALDIAAEELLTGAS